MKQQTLRNWLLLFGVVMAVLVVDQLTKNWIVANMAMGESRQPLAFLHPYFQITRSANTGAAFGFLPQAGNFFLVFAMLICGGMLYFYPRLPAGSFLTRAAMGFICGGAIGNAIDRLQYEHVVDFIHYQIPGVVSNVSNVADHAIVIGVLIMFVSTWQQEQKSQEAEDAQTPID